MKTDLRVIFKSEPSCIERKILSLLTVASFDFQASMQLIWDLH